MVAEAPVMRRPETQRSERPEEENKMAETRGEDCNGMRSGQGARERLESEERAQETLKNNYEERSVQKRSLEKKQAE